MDNNNSKRRDVSTHVWVDFSQSEMSSLLRGGGGGGGLKFSLLLVGGGKS